MRMSTLFGRRRRERPSDTDSASHDLLVRAGWIRRHAAGIYCYLTPGLRALRRIETIVRAEMEVAGAHEILLPVVHSADPWKATGRYDAIDATLARFADRRGHPLVLGMTHEEIVAELAATEIGSWREAGIVVFQIQTKFRDEARPRGGLLRTREFVMKDAYSLHVDRAGMEAAYAVQSAAYERIFARVGLADARRVRSAVGDMGGLRAHEFVALSHAGEDTVGVCAACGFAGNAEVLTGTVCGICGADLQLHRAIEVGNIFQLGTRYAEALGAFATDRDGVRRPLWMGSYGIGISRLLATLVERYHDDAGIALPAAVNAFDAHVIALGETDGATLATRLEAAGLDVLLEDRHVRAGQAFAEADLLGATVRVVVGGHSTGTQGVELRHRQSHQTVRVPTDALVDATLALIRDRGGPRRA